MAYTKIPLVPIWVSPQGWPWQIRESDGSWGWGHPGGHGRFGGGWRWKLGIQWGGSQCVFDLVFGYVRVSWDKKRMNPDE